MVSQDESLKPSMKKFPGVPSGVSEKWNFHEPFREIYPEDRFLSFLRASFTVLYGIITVCPSSWFFSKTAGFSRYL
jgi:hypothetical protein